MNETETNFEDSQMARKKNLSDTDKIEETATNCQEMEKLVQSVCI